MDKNNQPMIAISALNGTWGLNNFPEWAQEWVKNKLEEVDFADSIINYLFEKKRWGAVITFYTSDHTLAPFRAPHNG